MPRPTSDADIHRAYRELVRQYHPDLHPGNVEAEGKFIEVQRAFEELTRGGPESVAAAETHVHFYRHHKSPPPHFEKPSSGCLPIGVLLIVGFALVTLLFAIPDSNAVAQGLCGFTCFGVFVVFVLALVAIIGERLGG